MGDLNTMHEATIITTLFSVLATLCVTGPKEEGERGVEYDQMSCYFMSRNVILCNFKYVVADKIK